MLLNVKLENYLTVGNLSLDFDNGFIAITGESGAGKSILSSAIAATLGFKISSDCISTGEKNASVTTVFDISNNDVVKDILIDYEYQSDDEDDNDLIIRVVVDLNNRKKYFINGHIAKQKAVRDLSDHLVNYFGQNHQLKLIDPEFQVGIIDRYADMTIKSSVKHSDMLLELSDIYRDIKKNKKIIFDSKNDTGDSIGAISLLEYQQSELSEFNLSSDYIYGLKDKLSKMEEAKIVDDGVSKILHFLSDSDNDVGVSSILSDVLSTLSSIKNKSDDLGESFNSFFDKVSGLIIESSDLIKDARNHCGSYLDKSDGFSESEYNILSGEYKKLVDLSGKHNVPVDNLGRHLKMIEDNLAKLKKKTKTQTEIDSIIVENEKLISRYRELALMISDNRLSAAKSFESAANSKLFKLGFVNEKSLIVDVSKNDLDSEKTSENQFMHNGIDRVTFMLQPNLGQDAKPLALIASGGELSRVSLVLESIVSESSGSKVLFFDEIETGVSSNISKNMAFLLKEISGRGQIFAITHAPHIAASATHHIFVSKNNFRSGSEVVTKTNIKTLSNDNAIIQEISRMLVGDSKIINSEVYNVVKIMRLGEDVDIDAYLSEKDKKTTKWYIKMRIKKPHKWLF